MSEEISPLYAEILGDTARISWTELEPFFARGVLLWVDGQQDLIEVAMAISADDKQQVIRLMQDNLLCKLDDDRALDFQQRDPELWASVVSPWVLVQERSSAG